MYVCEVLVHRGEQTSEEVRKKIIAYHIKKIVPSKIHEKTNVASPTIESVIQKWKKTGGTVNLPRSHQEKCTTTW